MRINRNNGIMETNPCKDQKQGQGQGLDHKDQDKDKDLTHQDKDKDLTPKDQDKDKDLTPKDQDKDLRNVLKESLRTRTRINIPANKRLRVPAFFSSVSCADDEALTRLFQASFCLFFFGRFTSPGSFWIFFPFRSSLT